MKPNVLIVDDEPDMLSACKASLRKTGVHVTLEVRSRDALRRIRTQHFDLLITDIRMPDVSGIDLLKAAKEADPGMPVILMTAFPEVETAVEALRAGALDYLIKPVHPEDLKRRVQRALEERRLREENRLLVRHVEKSYTATEIVGNSPALSKLLRLMDKVAPTPADVLILGESGTGKELIARRLHAASGRKGRFVPVDCGAIPETLLENEFFGHERGAYTGADDSTPGLLEFAHGGTFFMDEVCELSAALQAKLLRVLQEKQVRRVGGHAVIDVDIRIVAATNKDIEREVREGRFREDMYYRLNVITLHAPPLRERSGDIPLLIDHFLPRFSREFAMKVDSVSDEAMETLCRYSWPGNIRELQNVLKKSLVQCEGSVLDAEHLPSSLMEDPRGAQAHPNGFVELRKRRMDSFEKEYLESILKRTRGNVKEAAKASDLPLSNLYFYLKKHRIILEDFR